MFPRQVHGISGFIVNKQSLTAIKPLLLKVTMLSRIRLGIGIGILTADCLPILMHDTRNKVIAAIHAGWRGSVAGIALKLLNI